MTDILVTVVELVVGLALGWFVADALILRQARRAAAAHALVIMALCGRG